VVLNYVQNINFLQQREVQMYSVEAICEMNLIPEIYNIPLEVRRINNQYVIITGENHGRI
jgi:hypothetical protein